MYDISYIFREAQSFMKKEMQRHSLFAALFTVLVIISIFNTACVSTSKGLSQFEQFSKTFLEETNKAGQTIVHFNELVEKLIEYENRIGTVSNPDYESIRKTVAEIPETKDTMKNQIDIAKDIGKSVSPDGYYTETKETVQGWDTGAYVNLHVDITLNTIDKNYTDSINRYNNIDKQLLAEPNKPFNNRLPVLLTEMKIAIASAKSDVTAKDWVSGKANVDQANALYKSVLKLDLNNIELYQVNLVQNDLAAVSNQILLGSALNETGSILRTAGEGAASILGGIGSILNNLGENIGK
jgi:hypothetical protein